MRITGNEGTEPERRQRRLARAGTAGAVVAGMVLAGWSGVSSAGTSAKHALGSPIVIGASLSLSGDFSADGQAFDRGYHLWQTYVNTHGGLLGHKVQLKILSDASSTSQVATNYNTLISTDHAKLVFGPFSSLLTVPAAKVVHRHGYAFVEGAGGAPSVFKLHLPDLFDVSYPVATGLVPFAKWIASLPSATRPTTAAYATVTTIFTSSQFPVARSILEKAGVKTVYTNTFPTETTDFTPIADAMAASHAQVALIGSVDVPTVSAFMQVFETAHYTPKAVIATAGPDQGSAFLQSVGTKNAIGMMVPGGWFPGYKDSSSKAMVKSYVGKYGGSASGINADVAEAFSVGEVVAQAVKATNGFTNKKIARYLHSGVTLNSVQGPVKFNSLGENIKGLVFVFQWQTKTGTPQYLQVLPKTAKGSKSPVFPKPAWGS